MPDTLATEPLATALLLTVFDPITGQPQHVRLPWGIVGTLGDRLQAEWLAHWSRDLPPSGVVLGAIRNEQGNRT